MLNVESTATEKVLVDLEDLSLGDTPELNREEVERAVRKLQNKNAAGDDRIVAELLKNGGEVVIELLQEVWKTKRVPQE